jgi:hypothetical protein
MQLFQIPPPPADLVVAPEPQALALEQRQTLLDVAESIKVVATAEENELAAQCGSGIQKMLNGVEAARKDLTAPYLAAQRAIKATADSFCEPLAKAMDRLGRLAIGYRQEQERKAEVERQARAAEIIRLQEQQRKAADDARKAAEAGDLAGALMGDLIAQAAGVQTSNAIALPEPETTKTAGQSFQDRVLGWECTDPIALWNARPDLCNPPEPKASAIKATCAPERPVPGLRLWWESKVSFKSR